VTDTVQEQVGEQPLWYHVLDLPGGVTTPGWFDLRPVVDRLPWPDVAGRRCLDVGTYDGFLAFEMERRGAAEVVAVDIDDHRLWDWPVDVRRQAPADLAAMAGPEKGRGFRIAATALGSSVRREPVSVYDLSPATVGTFDVVVVGSLLLHLRDPLRSPRGGPVGVHRRADVDRVGAAGPVAAAPPRPRRPAQRRRDALPVVGAQRRRPPADGARGRVLRRAGGGPLRRAVRSGAPARTAHLARGAFGGPAQGVRGRPGRAALGRPRAAAAGLRQLRG
jgi:SAM-dependent methyltransferase